LTVSVETCSTSAVSFHAQPAEKAELNHPRFPWVNSRQFLNVTMAGSTRIVWVKLHTEGDECDLMGLIGHELQHTIEVLGNRQMTSSGALYFFLRQEADAATSPAFETIAAKRTGEAVRTEVRHKNFCTTVH
jgi:hypothetical protein